MQQLLSYIKDNFQSILLLLFIIICVLLLLNYLFWMLGIGRFKKGDKTTIAGASSNSLIFVLTDFFVKIINDFRNLLALLLVLVFTGALIYACSISEGKVEELSKALQAVVSTLGGLVGSIVGYYFGESAAKSKMIRDNKLISDPAIQNGDATSAEEVTLINPPEEIK